MKVGCDGSSVVLVRTQVLFLCFWFSFLWFCFSIFSVWFPYLGLPHGRMWLLKRRTKTLCSREEERDWECKRNCWWLSLFLYRPRLPYCKPPWLCQKITVSSGTGAENRKCPQAVLRDKQELAGKYLSFLASWWDKSERRVLYHFPEGPSSTESLPTVMTAHQCALHSFLPFSDSPPHGATLKKSITLESLTESQLVKELSQWQGTGQKGHPRLSVHLLSSPSSRSSSRHPRSFHCARAARAAGTRRPLAGICCSGRRCGAWPWGGSQCSLLPWKNEELWKVSAFLWDQIRQGRVKSLGPFLRSVFIYFIPPVLAEIYWVLDSGMPSRRRHGSHWCEVIPPVRRGTIRKSTNNKCWRGCGEKGTLLHCQWECKLIQPLWRTVWRFLNKLKIELPYHSAIPLLGIYPEKTIIQKIHAPQCSLEHYLQ